MVGLSEDSCIERFENIISLIWSGKIQIASTMHARIRKKSQNPMKIPEGWIGPSIDGCNMEMTTAGSTQMHVWRIQRDSIVLG